MPEKAKTKLMLFDLDGTLYLDGVPYPGAIELIEKLRHSDIEYCFLTNNSSISPPDYCEKLRRIGFPLDPRNVLSSCEAAVYMLRKLHVGPELYLLGTERFRRWMEGQGLIHTLDKAQALLVAFDKELDYKKLLEATSLVLAGKPIYATHPDPVCPPGLPDAGMLLAYFQAAKPGTIIQAIAGKPHRWLCDVLQERFGVPPESMVMVGDRVGTDMRFAQNCGMRSMMTLNGVPMPVLGDVRPTVIVPHVRQLLDEFWPRNLGW